MSDPIKDAQAAVDAARDKLVAAVKANVDAAEAFKAEKEAWMVDKYQDTLDMVDDARAELERAYAAKEVAAKGWVARMSFKARSAIAGATEWVTSRLPWVILGAAVAVFLAFAAVRGVHAAELKSPEAQIRAVVAKIVSANELDKASCSAVVIAPDTAITANHCGGISDPILILEDGTKLRITTGMRYAPYTDDVAVITVPGLKCPCVPIATEQVRLDEPVLVGGYPMGLAKFVTHGTVQGRIPSPSSMVEYILTDAKVAPGNSGGGMFVVRDGKLELIGIIVALYHRQDRIEPWMITIAEPLVEDARP